MPPRKGKGTASLPAVTKLREGLFIGTAEAASCEEFLISNRITHIVNCAGQQVANYFTALGMQYLTFFLLDQDNSLFFDKDHYNITSLYEFIEEAHAECDGVLIHSLYGKSRVLFVAAAYLMRKFHWSAAAAIDFITFSRGVRMRSSFEQQLHLFETQLPQIQWTPALYEEEITMRNTFFNHIVKIKKSTVISQSKNRVRFYNNDTFFEYGAPPEFNPVKEANEISIALSKEVEDDEEIISTDNTDNASNSKYPGVLRTKHSSRFSRIPRTIAMQMYPITTQASPAFRIPLSAYDNADNSPSTPQVSALSTPPNRPSSNYAPSAFANIKGKAATVPVSIPQLLVTPVLTPLPPPPSSALISQCISHAHLEWIFLLYCVCLRNRLLSSPLSNSDIQVLLNSVDSSPYPPPSNTSPIPPSPSRNAFPYSCSSGGVPSPYWPKCFFTSIYSSSSSSSSEKPTSASSTENPSSSSSKDDFSTSYYPHPSSASSSDPEEVLAFDEIQKSSRGMVYFSTDARTYFSRSLRKKTNEVMDAKQQKKNLKNIIKPVFFAEIVTAALMNISKENVTEKVEKFKSNPPRISSASRTKSFSFKPRSGNFVFPPSPSSLSTTTTTSSSSSSSSSSDSSSSIVTPSPSTASLSTVGEDGESGPSSLNNSSQMKTHQGNASKSSSTSNSSYSSSSSSEEVGESSEGRKEGLKSTNSSQVKSASSSPAPSPLKSPSPSPPPNSVKRSKPSQTSTISSKFVSSSSSSSSSSSEETKNEEDKNLNNKAKEIEKKVEIEHLNEKEKKKHQKKLTSSEKSATSKDDEPPSFSTSSSSKDSHPSTPSSSPNDSSSSQQRPSSPVASPSPASSPNQSKSTSKKFNIPQLVLVPVSVERTKSLDSGKKMSVRSSDRTSSSSSPPSSIRSVASLTSKPPTPPHPHQHSKGSESSRDSWRGWKGLDEKDLVKQRLRKEKKKEKEDNEGGKGKGDEIKEVPPILSGGMSLDDSVRKNPLNLNTSVEDKKKEKNNENLNNEGVENEDSQSVEITSPSFKSESSLNNLFMSPPLKSSSNASNLLNLHSLNSPLSSSFNKRLSLNRGSSSSLTTSQAFSNTSLSSSNQLNLFNSTANNSNSTPSSPASTVLSSPQNYSQRSSRSTTEQNLQSNLETVPATTSNLFSSSLTSNSSTPYSSPVASSSTSSSSSASSGTLLSSDSAFSSKMNFITPPPFLRSNSEEINNRMNSLSKRKSKEEEEKEKMEKIAKEKNNNEENLNNSAMVSDSTLSSNIANHNAVSPMSIRKEARKATEHRNEKDKQSIKEEAKKTIKDQPKSGIASPLPSVRRSLSPGKQSSTQSKTNKEYHYRRRHSLTPIETKGNKSLLDQLSDNASQLDSSRSSNNKGSSGGLRSFSPQLKSSSVFPGYSFSDNKQNRSQRSNSVSKSNASPFSTPAHSRPNSPVQNSSASNTSSSNINEALQSDTPTIPNSPHQSSVLPSISKQVSESMPHNHSISPALSNGSLDDSVDSFMWNYGNNDEKEKGKSVPDLLSKNFSSEDVLSNTLPLPSNSVNHSSGNSGFGSENSSRGANEKEIGFAASLDIPRRHSFSQSHLNQSGESIDKNKHRHSVNRPGSPSFLNGNTDKEGSGKDNNNLLSISEDVSLDDSYAYQNKAPSPYKTRRRNSLGVDNHSRERLEKMKNIRSGHSRSGNITSVNSSPNVSSSSSPVNNSTQQKLRSPQLSSSKIKHHSSSSGSSQHSSLSSVNEDNNISLSSTMPAYDFKSSSKSGSVKNDLNNSLLNQRRTNVNLSSHKRRSQTQSTTDSLFMTSSIFESRK